MQLSVSFRNLKISIYIGKSRLYNHSGDDSNEDPPVPIPNTEVKLVYAESTIRDTVWEDR